MAITFERKQQFETLHQKRLLEAISQAVELAERDIDTYLEKHPGYRIPLGLLQIFMQTLDPGALIYGLWPQILTKLRCLYKEWVITEVESGSSPGGAGYLVFAKRGFDHDHRCR